MIAAGRNAISTPMTKRRGAGLGERADRDRPQPLEIDRQDRQDRAELDQHHEGLAERLVVEAEEVLEQQQVAGRRDGQEFGQALDHAEHDGLDQVEQHAELRGDGRDSRRDACRARPVKGQPKRSQRRVAGVLSSVGRSAQRRISANDHPLPSSVLSAFALRAPGARRVRHRSRGWSRSACGSGARNFLALNPAGTTPVLIEEGRPAVPGAAIIAEYLDETRGADSASAGCCPPIRSRASRCGG